MGDTLQFAAAQLIGLHTALGEGNAPNVKELSERLALFALTDFTDAERTAMHWTAKPDGTATFDATAVVTRIITEAQCKKIAEHVLSVAYGFPVPWVARWLVPALAILGDASLTEVKGDG
jgi:hypothetical protein